MKRTISNLFIKDLNYGILKNILRCIKTDNSLSIEIRHNYINIYYRGGSLLKVKEISNNTYDAYFDKNYIHIGENSSVIKECISNINTLEKANSLISKIPIIKRNMDIWMSMKKPYGGDREYKHIICRENNLDTGENDYNILDIDYEYICKDERKNIFDMVGYKINKDNTALEYEATLTFFNVRYDENSIDNNSTIKKDIDNIYNYLMDKNNIDKIYENIKHIYDIKRELGIIYDYENIKINNKLELIFIVINNNLKDKTLLKELDNIKLSKEYSDLRQIMDIKIAKSSFVGYRLYETFMSDIEETVDIISKIGIKKMI